MATYQAGPAYNKSDPYLTFTLTESSVNKSNNTSNISWTLVLHRPSSVQTSNLKTWKIVIDGKTYSSASNIYGSGDLTLSQQTITINHNSDGKKTISFSFGIDLSSIYWGGSGYLTNLSHSGTFKLTDITISSNEPFPYCSDNVYVKTENGLDIIYGSRKIQNAKHVICGTKEVSAGSTGSTSILLFTLNEIQQMFNDTSISRYIVMVCRDFREGLSHHLQTVTYINNGYYLVLSGNAGNTNTKHINYMIIAY